MARILLAVDRHYVYFLVDPSTNQLLYIGRSQTPRKRLAAHIKRIGRPLVIDSMIRCDSFEKACELELRMIQQDGPRLNQRAISSRGHLGQPGSEKARRVVSQRMKKHWSNPLNREAVSLQFKGKPKTKEHVEKIRQALLGRSHSEQRKLNISKAKKGQRKGIPQTPEHRAKRAEAMRRHYA